ncbi:hydrolase [Pseudoclavibacter sp. RFBJ3]|uniref:carbon-nitrogen hydrolase family protein n=1 Tax=unclassified Pseudoclavibacter TaxID=2615177 RepID=UPI000CE72F14|nr:MULTISPECIES: carbon-nitrogen hydrolase family protein [unclassified Pseudoclavibacter]PPF84760.1 hydrolase [Pseudoclavibacter sp. RFBJ5]PPF93763.1 hydrolase [Pseudoclavibacter sp. RFBJ3]PPF98480.1 hydrolase [Pseudoclavibacter sp. RFBH5]PPG24560.1 hydrolase [Pseudoclavibacter sp. RFBI4]
MPLDAPAPLDATASARGGAAKRSPLAVAVAQYAPGSDLAENERLLRENVALAADRGAQLVVVPEYASFFLPELGPELVRNAQDLDGPFVSLMRSLAAEHGVTIVAGLVATSEDPQRFANTLVAVDATGEVVAQYRKVHLYDAFGAKESDWVVAGDTAAPQTFLVGGVRVGLQTCYDLRFPEVSRTLVDAGAELIAIPAEWVRGPLKEHHWTTLLAARAIENTVYFAAADHPAPIGVGHSAVIDPRGATIAGGGIEAGLSIGWVSLEVLDSVREQNPALELRRYRVVPVEAAPTD